MHLTSAKGMSNASNNGSATSHGIGFTVAVTVWKREELLPHAVHSVVRQSRPADEVLVLSDGPSRLAPRLAEELAGVLPIRYEEVRRQRKRHGNHLRRRALEAATGSHVVILGHDCLLHAGCLAAHEANVGGDPEALSVVAVDYWRRTRPDGLQPRGDDLMRVGEGEIDLLCLALPRRLALAVDCFGDDMLRTRCADYLSFDRLRRETPPIYHRGAPQAAHF